MGPMQFIARSVSKCPLLRTLPRRYRVAISSQRHTAGGGEPSLCAGIRNVSAANLIGTARTGVPIRVAILIASRERQSALVYPGASELPTTQKEIYRSRSVIQEMLAFTKGEFVEIVGGKDVPPNPILRTVIDLGVPEEVVSGKVERARPGVVGLKL